jgi:hypothetical protein
MRIQLKNKARQALTVSYRDAVTGKVVGEKLKFNQCSEQIDDADLTAPTKNLVTVGHLQVVHVK